jgi:hypothetical protein
MRKPRKIEQPRNVRLNNTSRALFVIDHHEFILSFSSVDSWVKYSHHSYENISELVHTDNSFKLSLLNEKTYIVSNYIGMFRYHKL